MTLGPDWSAGRKPRWQAVLVLTLTVVVVLLLVPYAYRLAYVPWGALTAAGVAGYLCRRRPLDAGLFVAAMALAARFGEPTVTLHALSMLCLALLALSGRPLFALFTGSALLGILLAGAELKRQFAGSHLTWQDIRYFALQMGDNLGVMASQPTLLGYAAFGAAGIIGIAAVCWLLDNALHRRSVVLAWRQRMAARVLAASLALWSAIQLDATAKAFSSRDAWSFSEWHRAGPIRHFLSTAFLEPEARYHRQDTGALAAEVQAGLRSSAGPDERADILVFLQESQFNPSAIEACPPALCQLEIFRPDAHTTDDGELRVHIKGGGTWLSEFALATGMPHSVFGKPGEYASFNIAPRVQRSFIRSLKAAGYHTVAVYPVRGGMMNARAAYRAYGFDEFLDSNDLHLPGTFGTPDQQMHAAAVRVFRERQALGKPVFLLALTIFNHGEHGHASAMMRVPPSVAEKARDWPGNAVERANLADYVWRTAEFETAYRRTREAVLGSPRPTVLAWFGDHQPPFATAPGLLGRIHAAADQPAVPDAFVTWYHVATNRRTPAMPSRRQRLDITFLPGLLAERARVPLDDWLMANVLTRQRCGGLLMECRDEAARDRYLTYLLEDMQALR